MSEPGIYDAIVLRNTRLWSLTTARYAFDRVKGLGIRSWKWFHQSLMSAAKGFLVGASLQ